jgi:hypothetical protein
MEILLRVHADRWLSAVLDGANHVTLHWIAFTRETNVLVDLFLIFASKTSDLKRIDVTQQQTTCCRRSFERFIVRLKVLGDNGA